MRDIPLDIQTTARRIVTGYFRYMGSPGVIPTLETDHQRLADQIMVALMNERLAGTSQREKTATD